MHTAHHSRVQVHLSFLATFRGMANKHGGEILPPRPAVPHLSLSFLFPGSEIQAAYDTLVATFLTEVNTAQDVMTFWGDTQNHVM